MVTVSTLELLESAPFMSRRLASTLAGMTATSLPEAPAAHVRLATPRLLPWGQAVALHFAPGCALLLFYCLTAPLLQGVGLPPVWGLLLGTLLVLAPIELALVLRSRRRSGETRLLRQLGLQGIRRGDIVPTVLAGALSLVLPALVLWLEPIVHSRVFGWLPAWFGGGVGDLSFYSPAVAAVTAALWLGSLVLIGPAVEEIYFRGWLLPRLRGGTLTAAIVHAAMFSAYHLWQPYAVATVFVFILPVVVLVRRRGNPALGIVVHCTVNLFLFAAMLSGALQR